MQEGKESMHEYPITEQIIKIAEKHCREAEAERVRKVKLVIGDYSGYVGDSVHMYFDLIAEGTPVSYTHLDVYKRQFRNRREITTSRSSCR